MSLEVEGVSHWYVQPEETVLVDVSIRAFQGDSIAIMGPSGSGKTTLLSIMGLILEPARGTVTVDKEPIRGGWRKRILQATEIAWVFQTANILGRRSVLDNVALALVARGYHHERARAESLESIEKVGLRRLAERPAHTLSGGELQRIGVARAMVGHPRFVIADEPTAQLDRATSDGVVSALLTAKDRRTAVIVATHDPRVAERFERLFVLENGQLRAER